MTDSSTLYVRRLDPEVPIPARAYSSDAALDLCCRLAVKLEPRQRARIPTGVAVALPNGCAGLVLPRSGLASRLGLSVVNSPGLIDEDYRGEIEIALVNFGEEAVHLAPLTRVAQLLIVPIVKPTVIEVDKLNPTIRGVNGFGSTG